MITENFNRPANQSLVARANAVLSQSKIAVIRSLRVEADPMGLVLRGQVPLYYYKQLAQELVRHELDETPIFNRIEIIYSD